MKALRVDAPKAPPNLVNLDEPTPSDGEVIVSVAACGLNFADLLMSQGKYQEQPDFPLVPGLEVAGTVRRVGTGADPDLVGRRVAAFPGRGGLAETVNVAADRCILLPDRIDWVDAAASQVAYGTSHLALARTAQLQSGHTLLVTGAAGGVGLTAVELGKLMGARVVGVARGPDRCAIVEQAGADVVLDSKTDDIVDAVKSLGGADVVYDAVGGDGFRDLVRVTRPEGRILLIGFASGDLPDIRPNHLLVKNISVHGFYWGGFLAFNAPALVDSLNTVMEWIATGRIKPHVSHVLPLDRAAEALDLLRTRKATGKVVVTP